MTIMFNADQDAWDAAPEEYKEHLTRAIIHHAGHGPHPGRYQGEHPSGEGNPGEPSESDLARAYMIEHGPAREAAPQGQLPPQEAVQQPPAQKKATRPPAQAHGPTPAAAGAQAVQPQQPEGNF